MTLHTAARKYCMDQDYYWTNQYALLPRDRPYSDEDYATFPRYRFAKETLINIERLSFTEAMSIEEAHAPLLRAGMDAFRKLTEQLMASTIAVSALESQLSSYRSFLEHFNPSISEALTLPFRRVLLEGEVIALWGRLHDWWGIRGAGYGWFPLSEDAQPKGSLAFHTDLWNARQGEALFQEFLASLNVKRCFVLRELGPPDYELDREIANPAYDGSECFVFTDGDWIVYASHESSLTLAGSVAAYFQERWKDADTLAYGGPFNTPNLRGSWNWK